MSHASPIEDVLASAERLAAAGDVRDTLAKEGRIHIPSFMSADAASEMARQLTDLDWQLTLNENGSALRLPRDNLRVMAQARLKSMLDGAYANARDGFQFLYEMHPITDLYESGEQREGVFAEFHAAMNSPRGLAALRALTGEQRINRMNAWATRYQPGHFLTAHTDGESGTSRLYAYVLNLVPRWRADWGGLLMFYCDQGHVSQAYTPRLGALNIFKVPQAHAVSVVAPFAGGDRCAISGWFVGD